MVTMRAPADPRKIREFLERLGERSAGPGRVYLTGGASALLEGWRASTVDIDLKLDPEPRGVFEAIASLKNELDVNVELAAPDQFLPALPDWRTRSSFIVRHGEVDFFHYDFRAQALSKLARGYDRDIDDVLHMLSRGLVTKRALLDAFAAIEESLVRYPALDREGLVRRLAELPEETR